MISDIINQTFINIVAAIAILLIGLVLGRFIGKLIQKILNSLEIDKLLKIPLEEFIGSVIKYGIYVIAIIFALDQIGIAKIVVYLILIIMLIILIGYIIFSFKSFVSNFISGFILHKRGNIKVGDKIKVKNIEGKIIELNLSETKLRTKNNDILIVPNSIIQKNILLKKKK